MRQAGRRDFWFVFFELGKGRGMRARFDSEDTAEDGEQGESATPREALSMQRQIRLDDGGIGGQGEQGCEIGECVKTVGDGTAFDAGPPDLQQRAGGGEHQKRHTDGHTEDGEDGADGVNVPIAAGVCMGDPEDGGCRGEC